MHNMKKYLVSLLIGSLFLSACGTPPAKRDGEGQKPAGSGSEADKIMVVASFYPLAEFARQAGGDLVEVKNITPAGAEPHEYEPTPRDIAKIHEADLFLYNGAGQEPWAERIEEELRKEGVKVMGMTEKFSLIEAAADERAEEEETHEGQAEQHELDPHIWLDPVIALKEVEIIANELTLLDPENGQAYLNNASEYQKRLADLDAAFKKGLTQCGREEIITSHAAFGYMAQRYGFRQIAIAGLSPEAEPSARKLGELADLAEQKEIKYIFFETLASPRLSQTLASEIGARTLVLNPIEGLTDEEMAAGENYVTVMETNLENLRIALECQ